MKSTNASLMDVYWVPRWEFSTESDPTAHVSPWHTWKQLDSCTAVRFRSGPLPTLVPNFLSSNNLAGGAWGSFLLLSLWGRHLVLRWSKSPRSSEWPFLGGGDSQGVYFWEYVQIPRPDRIYHRNKTTTMMFTKSHTSEMTRQLFYYCYYLSCVHNIMLLVGEWGPWIYL